MEATANHTGPVVPDIDLHAVRSYRLGRVRQQLQAAGVDLSIVTNPANLRYTVDFREYQLFQSRIPTAMVWVPAEGPVVALGASNRNLDMVDEYWPSPLLTAFDSGPEFADRAGAFARTLAGFLQDIGAGVKRPRIAVEKTAPSVMEALLQAGFEVVDADMLFERAKSIKSAGELDCLRYSIAVAEHGMALMHQALQPGITENQLWAVFHQNNIAHDGDWIDGRMLASGARTNPWLQEATGKVVEAGELVAFDTDMIGPFGYCADISRTWFCGPGEPSHHQRDVYRHAFEEVHHNIALIRPGLSFRELSDHAYVVRDEFVARRYPCLAHGVGMSDEWPKIYYHQDWETSGYDGQIEAGMVLCVESYTGSMHGGEGVKLEQCVLVTDTGTQLLSRYPFESVLL